MEVSSGFAAVTNWFRNLSTKDSVGLTVASLTLTSLVLLRLRVQRRWFQQYATLSDEEIDRLKGRTVLITGGNSGIGLAAAKEFAKLGVNVIITVRNAAKGKQSVKEIKEEVENAVKVEYRIMENNNMKSVVECARGLAASSVDISTVVCNAGIGRITNPTEAVTVNGLNQIIQVNYFAHWVFIKLLWPKFVASADSGYVLVVFHHISFAAYDLI